jgi:pimeloyl-ACP methyl ester carboxylesterase
VLLEQEFGVSAIYLRYNTGLAIDANAQQFASLLERTAQAAPQVTEWLLVGHSMGGLVARRAHDLAAAEGLTWALRAPMIICLGSPHQGAPLEKLGHLAASVLDASEMTQPLGRIANARSQGIKDLRSGLKHKSVQASMQASPPALRLVFATLGDEADAWMGPLIGRMFGDGLVMAGSAADAGHEGDVERVELAGLGHMDLLNHPRVYALIRRWIGAPAIG